MKIVCASSVLFAREAFETLGETVIVPDASISPASLRDADALIVRSKTPVNEALLRDSGIGFVGTATAGTDHLDLDYLNRVPLAWCSAPGCNANSVAEYVVAALLCLAHRHPGELEGRTLGIVGVGEVGSCVAQKAEALGMTILRNDPPLALVTRDPFFLPIEEVLSKADILTLHVPLSKAGPFPTHRMANCRFFAAAKAGGVFVNTARGEAADTQDLLYALDHGAMAHAVVDVWENEPVVSRELLDRAALATPHIAGYSFEGRLNGTLAVYREACHFFEVEPSWTPEETLFPKPPVLQADAGHRSDESVLWEIVSAAHPIEKDDLELRKGATPNDAEWGRHFNALRKDYLARREFAAIEVRVAKAAPSLIEKIAALGFQIAAF